MHLFKLSNPFYTCYANDDNTTIIRLHNITRLPTTLHIE